MKVVDTLYFVAPETGEFSNKNKTKIKFCAIVYITKKLFYKCSPTGIGVMMLVSLTLERFVAVCYPEKSRAMQGSKKAYIIIATIPVITLLAHSPHMMRFSMVHCKSPEGKSKSFVYHIL